MAEYQVQQSGKTTTVEVVDKPSEDSHYHVDSMDEPALEVDGWDTTGSDITINKANMSLSEVRQTFGKEVAEAVKGEYNG